MLSLLLCLAPVLERIEQPMFIAELHTTKPYEAVMQDAEFAITERNLRIIERLHIGQAIRARGYDDFPHYDVLLFCNLEFTRHMLNRDPAWIHYCPARLSLREEEGKVVINIQLLPEPQDNPELRHLATRFNHMLLKILHYAAEP